MSDEYLNTLKEKILFYTENFKNNNKILEALNKMLKIVKILLDANEENLSHSKEGGFIVENILFGSEIFSDLKELSINQVLFILNSNNYSSIQNLRKVSSMYISYRYAKKKEMIILIQIIILKN